MNELANKECVSCKGGVRPLEGKALNKLKKQLESGRKTVNEVMYDVGYSDTKAFRDVFKKITGMSPIDYRNKYNREMAF